MPHRTGNAILHLAAIAAGICLSMIVFGCVAPPPPCPACPTPMPVPIVIPPLPGSTPVGVLDITGLDKDAEPATLEIAAAHSVADWQLGLDTWKCSQNQPGIRDKLQEIKPVPAYLEYALVLQADETWRLFYAEPPTRTITITQVQVHAVDQWQKNAESVFSSGPAFKVASSSPISPTAPPGVRVETEQGLDLIGAAMGYTSTVPAGDKRIGETAFLLLTDGNSQAPDYTLVVLGGVEADGSVPPGQPGLGDACRKYCTGPGKHPWWCKFC